MVQSVLNSNDKTILIANCGGEWHTARLWRRKKNGSLTVDEEEPVTGRATGIFQVNTLTTGQSLKKEFCTKKDKYGFALDASSEYEARVINCFRHLFKSTAVVIFISYRERQPILLGRPRNRLFFSTDFMV